MAATARDRVHSAILPRLAVLGTSALIALVAAWLETLLARADGWTALDTLRLLLSTLCVFWLSWGTMVGLLGLLPWRAPPSPAPTQEAAGGRTAVLMPIYHEDPPSTFARVAAISARLTALGAHGAIDLFILSDSQSLEATAREALWLERLLTDCPARQQIFYRRRSPNAGRKAGNIEDFIRRSGAAYDYAVVLDADSLMDAESIMAMIARMEASPRLGLLQTLPLIVHARSIFGRALQFSAALYTPRYARGTAMLQGREGPYWGHNAIFRVAAFAQSCGLPPLRGRPPFGGQILSHDYVEAALLARGGYEVQLDPAIPGSYEEGPDNIVEFAKRDQRWCQGNLQHSRVLLAPALRLWNRVTLAQGILNYLMPPVWLVLLLVGFLAANGARLHFGPAGPDWASWVLIGFIVGLLILPKLLIAGLHVLARGAGGLGERAMVLISALAEIVLSTVTAPIVLMFQVRAVLRILSGFDGGWPASNRADSVLTLGRATQSSWWITCSGAAALALVIGTAPALTIWSLPVTLPMVLAPVIISVTSRPMQGFERLWRVPSEAAPSPVLQEWQTIHHAWTGAMAGTAADFGEAEAANVLG